MIMPFEPPSNQIATSLVRCVTKLASSLLSLTWMFRRALVIPNLSAMRFTANGLCSTNTHCVSYARVGSSSLSVVNFCPVHVVVRSGHLYSVKVRIARMCERRERQALKAPDYMFVRRGVPLPHFQLRELAITYGTCVSTLFRRSTYFWARTAKGHLFCSSSYISTV